MTTVATAPLYLIGAGEVMGIIKGAATGAKVLDTVEEGIKLTKIITVGSSVVKWYGIGLGAGAGMYGLNWAVTPRARFDFGDMLASSIHSGVEMSRFQMLLYGLSVPGVSVRKTCYEF